MTFTPLQHKLSHRKRSHAIPRTNPQERLIQAILLTLKRKENTLDKMLKLARKGEYEYRILITILDECRAIYAKHILWEAWLYRIRLIRLLTRLYSESNDRLFYDSICRLPFLSARDKRHIFNGRYYFLGKRVSIWHSWPLLGKRVSF